MSKEQDVTDNSLSNWQQFGRSRYDWVLIAGLLGFLPLLVLHAGNLWNRPHFQFFPLAWAAFAAIVYYRGSVKTTVSPLRYWFGILMLVGSIIGGAISVLYLSPWFAHAGLILLCLGWLLIRLAGTAWYTCLGWMTLLVVTLPLPLNLDERLIQNLQARSTHSASALLDLTGTPHLALGNVIEIRSGKLFVDEACSGVDSLYALTALALLIAIWYQHGLLVNILTLISVPVWAWFGNLVRIYVIAVVFDQYNVDWTHGWQHTLLGLVVFVATFACLLATQKTAIWLLSPFPVESATTGLFHRWYNVAATWPGRDPMQRESKRAHMKVTRSELTGHPRLGIVLAICFLVCGIASVPPALGIGPWKPSGVAARQISKVDVESTFNADSLPKQLSGFQQVGFEFSHRERDSIFGEHSATWTYRNGEQPVTISLDFPFPGFHALEVCYELSGSQFLQGVTETNAAEDQHLSSGTMVDQFGEESYLCYTEFSSEGQSSSRNSGTARGIFKPIERSALFQLQVLVPNAEQLSASEKEAIQGLLLDIRELLLPRIQQLVAKES